MRLPVYYKYAGLDEVGRMLREAEINWDEEEEEEKEFIMTRDSGSTDKLRKNRKRRSRIEKDGLNGGEDPEKDGISARVNPGEDISCVEYEEFCKLGDKVRQNNLQIGEALPLVYR